MASSMALESPGKVVLLVTEDHFIPMPCGHEYWTQTTPLLLHIWVRSEKHGRGFVHSDEVSEATQRMTRAECSPCWLTEVLTRLWTLWQMWESLAPGHVLLNVCSERMDLKTYL